jgi:hypothetical protein
MKKSICIALFSAAVTCSFAQDLTSKKGESILPEKGDWSIGVDATPFLNYIGNFFGTPNSAPSFKWITTNNSIVGKYFIEQQTALRAGIRIGFNNSNTRYNTVDRAAALTPGTYPGVVAQKENTWRQSNSSIGLSVGIEKRKGKTRLQGFYGGEVGLYLKSMKDQFTYGNRLIAPGSGVTAITVDSVTDGIDNAFNFVGNPPVQGTDQNGGRITERKYGTQFSFGLRGFIGVEFFILPKISLGGEFGWGLGFSTTGKSSTTYETIGTTTVGSSVARTSVTSPKSGAFGLDTDNKNSLWGPSGTLRLNFYF